MWIFSVFSVSSVVKAIDLEIINLSKVLNQNKFKILWFYVAFVAVLRETLIIGF